MRWLRSWGVAAFVVLDLVVLGLTWKQAHRSPVSDAAATSAPTASSTGSSASSSTSQIHGPLFLATRADGAVLRVTRGSCDSRDPEQARVWVASGTNQPLTVRSAPGLQEALGVAVTDKALQIVGADSSCTVHGWVSTDDGGTWKQGAVPDRVWYLDTDTTQNALHGPVAGGVQNLECTPVSVLTLDGGASALASCSGSNVLAVSDDPKVAAVSYAVPDPVAAAPVDGGLPLVLVESDGCTAALDRITSQEQGAQIACLSQTGAPLGLASSGQRVLAQVGQKLLLSTDGGASFADYP